ncbi:unnamed protein product [Rhizoctonia solani]|uniref:Transmembrane protein n=1 Tax=Rhizoctonia solani TaxID=456999 RepID=A0A8H3B0S8_9AGAM|nr:unnamed protein product [Rhizoctonia solani]
MVRMVSVRSLAIATLFSVSAYADPWTNVTCTNPNLAWVAVLTPFNNHLAWLLPILAPYAEPTIRGGSLNSAGVQSITSRARLPSAYVRPLSGAFWQHALYAKGWIQAGASMFSFLSNGAKNRTRLPRWTVYANDCTIADTSPPGIYPAAIPSGVAVPDWAYYDFVTAGVFNQVIASQQTGPESTAPPGASSTAASTASTATSTSTAAPVNNSSGGSNTGAIVGGVVGGVLGIALVALIGFIVVRKNKQSKPGPHELPPTPTELTKPAIQYDGGYTPYYQPVAQSPNVVPTTQSYYKPYDPSDPSTFPVDPHANSPNPPESVPPLSYSQHTDTRPSHYHGVPEL